MNTTAPTDETNNFSDENPGSKLGRIRESRGFTKEYVAGKLHLRVKVIELLEADDYQQMPEPVFIMGYLRAYAKLLGVSPEPYIIAFNNLYALEKKPEKALWQSRRESNKGELVVRWITGMVAMVAIIAITFWWQKNKEDESVYTEKAKEAVKTASNSETEIKLTDLSKMQSMFSSRSVDMPLEIQGG